jgi:hypothetical protein
MRRWPGRLPSSEIVKFFMPHHLLENTHEASPIVLLALSHMFHSSLEPP